MSWWSLLGKPLVPGLSSCWLGRVSSAAGPQESQSREPTDLRSYGNRTNSESAEVSCTRSPGFIYELEGGSYMLLTRKHSPKWVPKSYCVIIKQEQGHTHTHVNILTDT